MASRRPPALLKLFSTRKGRRTFNVATPKGLSLVSSRFRTGARFLQKRYRFCNRIRRPKGALVSDSETNPSAAENAPDLLNFD
ncbi:hypothetical protein BRAO375_4410003 [Bradyrhizobium sp. ORS 375]|nr:hypothetical protein BRAO375_4410003 [Bradyrhizobium sp. ORS 375]